MPNTYVCVCVRACAHVCVCAHVRASTCSHVCVCAHVCVRARVHVYVCVCQFLYVTFTAYSLLASVINKLKTTKNRLSVHFPFRNESFCIPPGNSLDAKII